MFQLRRKLMNLMDKQYQGRDGITDEVDQEKELENSARFVKDLCQLYLSLFSLKLLINNVK